MIPWRPAAPLPPPHPLPARTRRRRSRRRKNLYLMSAGRPGRRTRSRSPRHKLISTWSTLGKQKWSTSDKRQGAWYRGNGSSLNLSSVAPNLAACCATRGCGDYVVQSVRQRVQYRYRSRDLQVEASGSYAVYSGESTTTVQQNQIEQSTYYEIVLHRVPTTTTPLRQICAIPELLSVPQRTWTPVAIPCWVEHLGISVTNGQTDVSSTTADAAGIHSWKIMSSSPPGTAGTVDIRLPGDRAASFRFVVSSPAVEIAPPEAPATIEWFGTDSSSVEANMTNSTGTVGGGGSAETGTTPVP